MDKRGYKAWPSPWSNSIALGSAGRLRLRAREGWGRGKHCPGLSPGPFLTVLHHCPKDKTSWVTCTASGAAECSKNWKEFCGSCGKSGTVIWKQCGRLECCIPCKWVSVWWRYDVLCLSSRGINKNTPLPILWVFHLRRGCEEIFW